MYANKVESVVEGISVEEDQSLPFPQCVPSANNSAVVGVTSKGSNDSQNPSNNSQESSDFVIFKIDLTHDRIQIEISQEDGKDLIGNEDIVSLCMEIHPREFLEMKDSNPHIKKFFKNDIFMEMYYDYWKLNLGDYYDPEGVENNESIDKYNYFHHLIKSGWKIPEKYFQIPKKTKVNLFKEFIENIEIILSAAIKLDETPIISKVLNLSLNINLDLYFHKAVEDCAEESFFLLEECLSRTIGGFSGAVDWTDLMCNIVRFNPYVYISDRAYGTNKKIFEFISNKYSNDVDWTKVATEMLCVSVLEEYQFNLVNKNHGDVQWKSWMNKDGTCCKSRTRVKFLLEN